MTSPLRKMYRRKRVKLGWVKFPNGHERRLTFGDLKPVASGKPKVLPLGRGSRSRVKREIAKARVRGTLVVPTLTVKEAA